jgi:DNA-directed RNA polymerase subunit alpha
MEQIILPQIQTEKEEENVGIFVIEPLYPGYGQTIGNALRRVLLSSLEGAAISSVKIEGISHEFSSIPGVKEDVIELILNLKQLRMKLFSDEPVKMTLNVKGAKEVTAKDIKAPSQVEIVNKDFRIATLDGKDSSLSMEMVVEKGRGYLPVEMKTEKPEIGVIQIDSLFSPVLGVNFKVENTRVGQRVDFNKLILEIKTDGTITPSEALVQASKILVNQFELLANMPVKKEVKEKSKSKEKKAKGTVLSKKDKKGEKTTKKKRTKKSSA